MSDSQTPQARLKAAAEAYDEAAAQLEAWTGDQSTKAFLQVWDRFRAALRDLTEAARAAPAAEQAEDA